MTKYIVGAFAALALLATGCKNNQDHAAREQQDYQRTVAKDEQKKAEVNAKEQEKLSKVDQDLAKDKADDTRDLQKDDQKAAEKRADIQKDAAQDRAKLDKDEMKEKQDADKANAEAARDTGNTGFASGTGDVNKDMNAGTAMTVTGTVKGTPMGNLTLVDEKGGEIKLDADKTTQVISNGQAMKVNDLKEGAQVRAAYRMDGNKKHADKIEVIANPAKDQKVRDDGSVEMK